MKDLKIISSAATASVWMLIVIGGFVTSIGAGLACPDWPLCNSKLIPDLSDRLVLAEYTHRLFTVLVTLLVISTNVMAWKRARSSARIVRTSTLCLLLLITQIILGMLTVNSGLNPLVVTAHLGLAMTIFGSSLATTIMIFVTSIRATTSEQARFAQK